MIAPDLPTISVVIPAFNEEDLIGRAIDSVLRQTIPPLEIIIVDDGSTDTTGDIVKSKYVAPIGVVKYIYQNNRGLAAARNTGIAHSKGDFVAFLDSDDEWNGEFIEKSTNVLASNPDLKWCISGYERRSDDGSTEFIRVVPPALVNNSIIDNYFAVESKIHISIVNTTIIKRSILNELGGFDEQIAKHGEDLDLWFRVALADRRVGYVDYIGSVYWKRKGSITSGQRISVQEMITRMLKAEAHAYAKGLSATEIVAPLIADWGRQCIKRMVYYADKPGAKSIFRLYFGKLHNRERIILIAALLLPQQILAAMSKYRYQK